MGANDGLAQPDGEHESFETFFRRETPRVVGLVVKAGYSRAEAEEATQSAMAEAYVSWEQVRYPDRWVRTVALRMAHAAARRRRTDVTKVAATGDPQVVHDDGARVAVVNERGRLIGLLSDLPPQQRIVMALRVDGYETKEIAEMMDLQPATVRRHLHDAREKLKRILESEASGEGV